MSRNIFRQFGNFLGSKLINVRVSTLNNVA